VALLWSIHFHHAYGGAECATNSRAGDSWSEERAPASLTVAVQLVAPDASRASILRRLVTTGGRLVKHARVALDPRRPWADLGAAVSSTLGSGGLEGRKSGEGKKEEWQASENYAETGPSSPLTPCARGSFSWYCQDFPVILWGKMWIALKALVVYYFGLRGQNGNLGSR
jgi:hypothetical protein